MIRPSRGPWWGAGWRHGSPASPLGLTEAILPTERLLQPSPSWGESWFLSPLTLKNSGVGMGWDECVLGQGRLPLSHDGKWLLQFGLGAAPQWAFGGGAGL